MGDWLFVRICCILCRVLRLAVFVTVVSVLAITVLTVLGRRVVILIGLKVEPGVDMSIFL